MGENQGDEYMLTRSEAANYLGCTVSLLNKLAWANPEALPYTKIGRGSRYRKSDLDTYLKNKKRGIK